MYDWNNVISTAEMHKTFDWLTDAFIHSVVCRIWGPKPLPKPILHRVWSIASFFNFQYPFPSLRLSSSFLHLLPRLLVTSVFPSIFPSITWFRRQFLCQLWPIQLAILLWILCGIFLSSLTLYYTSFLTRSVQPIFPILLQQYTKLCSKCSTLLFLS